MFTSPRRRIVAAGLAGLVPLTLALSACGQDPVDSSTEAGEVVYGGLRTELGKIAKSSVLTPAGRLDIEVSELVESLPSAQTAERRERSAPAGGAFLPIRWTFDTDALGLGDLFGDRQPINIELVTDQETHALPPPSDTREGEPDIFFTALAETPKTVSLAVEYDGVTQTVNLVSGEREPGVADGLYELTKFRQVTRNCDTSTWRRPERAQSPVACNIGDPLVSPYIDGEWAEEGRAWLAFTLSTNLVGYRLTGPDGATAAYSVASSTDLTRLDGEEPRTVLNLSEIGGAASGVYVFDIDGSIPKDLLVLRRYVLELGSVVGDVDAPDRQQAKIGGKVPLQLGDQAEGADKPVG